MSFLQGITAGPSQSGIRMVIAGQEKMGKTTISCGAPNVLLIPIEVGYSGVTVAKTPMIQNYETLVQCLQEIMGYAVQGAFPYKSLVFDSATALERLIDDYVIRLDPASKNGVNKTVTMESCHGGFGKGYNMANTLFKDLLAQFDLLAINAGINIVFTAHVFSSKVNDPTVGEYDSWDLLLHSPKNQKTYGKRELLTQWADVIGFLYEPLILVENANTNTNRGISQNKGRVLAVNRTPAYLAGNRFGILGEISIPAPPENGWNHFADKLLLASGIDLVNRV
jgi:hypothetical protein